MKIRNIDASLIYIYTNAFSIPTAPGLLRAMMYYCCHLALLCFRKKSNKPIKPKTTIQIVSDSREDEVVSPMYITAAQYRDVEALCICYGSAVAQTFEDIVSLRLYSCKKHCPNH